MQASKKALDALAAYVPAPRQSKPPTPAGSGNRTANRGHRSPGTYNNTKQVAAWQTLAGEITAHLAAHPAVQGLNTGNGANQPGSLKGLAAAMGLANSRSTLRHMLRGTCRADSDGARIPGSDKIKAARAWLKAARKEAGL